jgi:predicted nucleic acid-binding protein
VEVVATYQLDTSVIKRLHRPAVSAAVHPLAGSLARPSIVDLELGYSARNETEWDQIRTTVAELDRVPTTQAHVERALEIQRALAARSKRGRKIVDLLIAAAAEEHGLTVLHYDGDFDLIAAVTHQPTQWVVPAGTVD